MKNIIPKTSMPRERLAKLGSEALSDYELLAIILRTGTRDKNVLDLAKDMLSSYHNLHYLNNITLEGLTITGNIISSLITLSFLQS